MVTLSKWVKCQKTKQKKSQLWQFYSFRIVAFVTLCFFSLSISKAWNEKLKHYCTYSCNMSKSIYWGACVWHMHESVLMKETNYFFYLWWFLVGEAGTSVNVNFHPHWKLFRWGVLGDSFHTINCYVYQHVAESIKSLKNRNKKQNILFLLIASSSLCPLTIGAMYVHICCRSSAKWHCVCTVQSVNSSHHKH